MSNIHKRAFPSVIRPSEVELGLTALEYFANSAPDTIPEWFKHVAPDRATITKYPMALDYMKETDPFFPEFKSWTDDPCYDMTTDVLVDFARRWREDVDKHWATKDAWNLADKTARFFQWRIFYAKELIKQLADQ